MDNEAISIKNLPQNERPRERLIYYGAGSLSNAELLAILLRSGTQKENVITMAQRMLLEGSKDKQGRDEQLAFLYDSTIEELSEIDGIGEAKACSILAAVELGKRVARAKRNITYFIKTPKDGAEYMMDRLRFENREQVYLILLNAKAGIIDDILISMGGLSSSIIHPREVFSIAVKKSAASIVLVHNHPSGDPSPSQDDVKITKRILEAGKIMGIELIDHIIIGDNKYVSLREKGVI